jgi:hypothetical protein
MVQIHANQQDSPAGAQTDLQHGRYVHSRGLDGDLLHPQHRAKNDHQAHSPPIQRFSTTH